MFSDCLGVTLFTVLVISKSEYFLAIVVPQTDSIFPITKSCPSLLVRSISKTIAPTFVKSAPFPRSLVNSENLISLDKIAEGAPYKETFAKEELFTSEYTVTFIGIFLLSVKSAPYLNLIASLAPFKDKFKLFNPE